MKKSKRAKKIKAKKIKAKKIRAWQEYQKHQALDAEAFRFASLPYT